MPEQRFAVKVAIQGELGSNSHMAALEMLRDVATELDIVACATSAEVFERVAAGAVDGAVLPIENSLHGSVAEHYDLLLAQHFAHAFPVERHFACYQFIEDYAQGVDVEFFSIPTVGHFWRHVMDGANAFGMAAAAAARYEFR